MTVYVVRATKFVPDHEIDPYSVPAMLSRKLVGAYDNADLADAAIRKLQGEFDLQGVDDEQGYWWACHDDGVGRVHYWSKESQPEEVARCSGNPKI